MSKRIDVHYVTRVEGHGNIVVEVADGKLKDCRFEVVEAPRFFEAMLRGRPYCEASRITSRICGICSTGHATASLRATEKALGIQPSEQTQLLRKLVFHGEVLDSHILHVYMLVAPDFLGVGSVIPLAESHPEIVRRALRLKKLAGDICKVVAGRHTHPIAMTVGGFTHFPIPDELGDLRQRLAASRADVEATVRLFASLPWPAFERETEYVSLQKPDEYAFVDGEIVTSDGGRLPVEDYRQVTNEYLVPHSTAKHTRHKRESYMVGALARFNNNFEQLHPRAKEAAAMLGLRPKVTNPFLNSAAQVVEIVHCTEAAIAVIDRLLARGITHEAPVETFRRNVSEAAHRETAHRAVSTEGVGACEVPRGLLIHHYWIGEDGKMTGANCVIPTNQNLANLEADMRARVPQIADEPVEALQLDLEMLVRAYDPCISCSVHVLQVSPPGPLSRRETSRVGRGGEATLVLCVGNPLRGDDGLGARVAGILSERQLPPGTRVEAIGTPGWGLANWLAGSSRVILVDAVRMGQGPGAWRRFGPEDVRLIAGQSSLSLHEPDVANGLALAQALGGVPEEIVFFGVEPASTEAGQALSPAVEQALPELVEAVLAEVWKKRP